MSAACDLSRLVQHRSGLDDAPGWNHGTILIGRGQPAPLAARELFVRHYQAIRDCDAQHPRQGVAVLAFDRQSEPIGVAWLAAGEDRARALIIGRHSRCGLVIPVSHSTIALRHLVVTVRLTQGRPLARIIDLCTHTGFVDESGRVLQSASIDGPAFLASEEVQLVFLTTGDEREWDDDPEVAFDALPRRDFVDERVKTWTFESPPRAFEEEQSITSVSAILPPLAPASPLLEAGEVPCGHLFVGHGGHSVQRSVGKQALVRGILLGRYARCALGGDFRNHGRISRVHLLLILDGEEVIAIDTASTNGTRLESERIELIPLSDGMSLDVAKVLNVVWSGFETPEDDQPAGEGLSHSVLLEAGTPGAGSPALADPDPSEASA